MELKYRRHVALPGLYTWSQSEGADRHPQLTDFYDPEDRLIMTLYVHHLAAELICFELEIAYRKAYVAGWRDAKKDSNVPDKR